MQAPLATLVARCREILAGRAPTHVRDVDLVLADVAALRDAACIVPLLSCFEDRPPYDEAMFSIVHTIEDFDDATYVRELLIGTAELHRASPRWERILYVRVLNSKPARAELARQLGATSDAVREGVRVTLERIASANEPASEGAVAVLAALR